MEKVIVLHNVPKYKDIHVLWFKRSYWNALDQKNFFSGLPYCLELPLVFTFLTDWIETLRFKQEC